MPESRGACRSPDAHRNTRPGSPARQWHRTIITEVVGTRYRADVFERDLHFISLLFVIRWYYIQRWMRQYRHFLLSVLFVYSIYNHILFCDDFDYWVKTNLQFYFIFYFVLFCDILIIPDFWTVNILLFASVNLISGLSANLLLRICDFFTPYDVVNDAVSRTQQPSGTAH